MRREQLREEAGRPVLAGDVVSVRHMCSAAVACVSEATNAGPTGCRQARTGSGDRSMNVICTAPTHASRVGKKISETGLETHAICAC